MLWLHALTVFMGFFAIMNPIANVPIFLSLTADNSAREVRSIARRSLLLAFGIVLIFAVAGNLIFQVFGISLNAFRITGGLLVFLIGFHMLQGSPSRVQNVKNADNPVDQDAALSVAITPLAMPILAGPGTIATTMNFAATGGWLELLITVAIFALLCFITYGLFLFGRSFVEFIGLEALAVITRMMGLILAVMGTQMLIEGIGATWEDYQKANNPVLAPVPMQVCWPGSGSA